MPGVKQPFNSEICGKWEQGKQWWRRGLGGIKCTSNLTLPLIEQCSLIDQKVTDLLERHRWTFGVLYSKNPSKIFCFLDHVCSVLDLVLYQLLLKSGYFRKVRIQFSFCCSKKILKNSKTILCIFNKEIKIWKHKMRYNNCSGKQSRKGSLVPSINSLLCTFCACFSSSSILLY